VAGRSGRSEANTVHVRPGVGGRHDLDWTRRKPDDPVPRASDAWLW
jgi:hypothetical protein